MNKNGALTSLGAFLIFAGVIYCAWYWAYQIPRPPFDMQACIRMKETGTVGTLVSREDEAAWHKAIEAECKESQ